MALLSGQEYPDSSPSSTEPRPAPGLSRKQVPNISSNYAKGSSPCGTRPRSSAKIEGTAEAAQSYPCILLRQTTNGTVTRYMMML